MARAKATTKTGRKTKLVPDVIARLLQAIQLGATYEQACAYAGIAYNTFNEWMKEGMVATSGDKMELYEQVQEAQGLAAVGWLAKIEKAANIDWRAAAWKLERRYPKDFGRVAVDVTMSGQLDHQHTHTLPQLPENLTFDQLFQLRWGSLPTIDNEIEGLLLDVPNPTDQDK